MDILIEICKAMTPNPLLVLDERLAKIKKSSRFFQFHVPGTNKGGYFSSNANYAAFEHRAIMQVSVHWYFELMSKMNLYKLQCKWRMVEYMFEQLNSLKYKWNKLGKIFLKKLVEIKQFEHIEVQVFIILIWWQQFSGIVFFICSIKFLNCFSISLI